MTKILVPFQSSWIDYPDNQSIAVMVVMMGCDNGCPHCQNPQFKDCDYNNGTKDFMVEELEKELDIQCQRNMTNKVVLSGGDPLSCFNVEFTKKFLSQTKYDVCIYSGHDVEYCKKHNINGFKFLKCGKFDNQTVRESKKTDDYMVFASPNQELYNENYCLMSKDGIYYFNDIN